MSESQLCSAWKADETSSGRFKPDTRGAPEGTRKGPVDLLISSNTFGPVRSGFFHGRIVQGVYPEHVEVRRGSEMGNSKV